MEFGVAGVAGAVVGVDGAEKPPADCDGRGGGVTGLLVRMAGVGPSTKVEDDDEFSREARRRAAVMAGEAGAGMDGEAGAGMLAGNGESGESLLFLGNGGLRLLCSTLPKKAEITDRIGT